MLQRLRRLRAVFGLGNCVVRGKIVKIFGSNLMVSNHKPKWRQCKIFETGMVPENIVIIVTSL